MQGLLFYAVVCENDGIRIIDYVKSQACGLWLRTLIRDSVCEIGEACFEGFVKTIVIVLKLENRRIFKAYNRLVCRS